MRIERIPVRETNCYLLSEETGTVLIDPGPPGHARTVAAQVERLGIRPAHIGLILVTHGHLDHYGCAAEVKAWCGAPVAAPRGEPELSQDRRYALPPAQSLRASLMRWVYLRLSSVARFEPLEADMCLDEGHDLSAFGVSARTIHIPGHSARSLGVFTTENDVFVGDLFVNYTVPSQPIYLLDREAWKQSCERVRSLAPRTVYIGHGEPFRGDQLGHIYPPRYQFRWWVW